MLERVVVDALIKRENLVAQREFHIDGVGFVDILTKDEIIEVKEAASWKHALGQVLAYSTSLPKTYRKRIHLFRRNGENIDAYEISVAERICRLFDVHLTHEGGSYIRYCNSVDRSLAWLDRFRFTAR